MTLIVEDGTIVAGAESYCTVAYATTYHSNRGNTAWAALASDTVREQCLRKSTDYMMQVYRARWIGDRVDEDQVLDWPRESVEVDGFDILITTIPVEIKNACAELALKASAATLYDDQTQAVLEEQVGDIKVVYDGFSVQSVRYKSIDAMLEPYLMGNACNTAIRQ